MHINTSYIEIEVIFKNKYTKLKPFAVLRAVGSVYSVFSSHCIPFSVSSTLRNVLLDCFNCNLNFPTYKAYYNWTIFKRHSVRLTSQAAVSINISLLTPLQASSMSNLQIYQM